MSLDKKETPIGLSITHFIVANAIWYLIFSMVYWDFNLSNWWLTQSVWGRLIILFIEFVIFSSAFNIKKNENS